MINTDPTYQIPWPNVSNSSVDLQLLGPRTLGPLRAISKVFSMVLFSCDHNVCRLYVL